MRTGANFLEPELMETVDDDAESYVSKDTSEEK
jgi:hypothetical protein